MPAKINGSNSHKKNAASTQTNSDKKAHLFKPGNPYRWPAGVSGNPKGRPTRHEDLEEVLQEFFSERVKLSDGQDVPRLYALLRDMASSRTALDHTALLEHAFGKVTQPITVKDITDKPDSELVAELQSILDATAAKPSVSNHGGVETPGSDSGSA